MGPIRLLSQPLSFPRLQPQNSPIKWAVRTCVIFNPAAKGDKARHFRRHLDEIGAESTLKQTTAVGLKQTTAVGDARTLAAEAVREGFEIVVAAGGDGTLNEVLNGIGDVPGGLQRVRLGVLPLGTVNVFARELDIPRKLEPAWQTIRQGRETRIDLGGIEYSLNGTTARRYFVQLAGAGLDARAIELVNWPLKKKIGPLAYVVAGLQALAHSPAHITVSDGTRTMVGGLVLIGNGRLYGGAFAVFPQADPRDGVLEVCVFPRVNWLTLIRCAPRLLLRGFLPTKAVERFRAATFTLTSPAPTPLEVDGELIGQLPAKFFVEPRGLRVIIP
jgi:diacylglycerol kinase (ATP)